MRKEALARIKINAILKESGWRFFDDNNGPANIVLELNTKLKIKDLNDFGKNFEKTKKGYIDFLLLDKKGFPLAVLEAKSGSKDPVVGKKQAENYAKAKRCHFVILSNGDTHYFWDLNQNAEKIIL